MFLLGFLTWVERYVKKLTVFVCFLLHLASLYANGVFLCDAFFFLIVLLANVISIQIKLTVSVVFSCKCTYYIYSFLYMTELYSYSPNGIHSSDSFVEVVLNMRNTIHSFFFLFYPSWVTGGLEPIPDAVGVRRSTTCYLDNHQG